MSAKLPNFAINCNTSIANSENISTSPVLPSSGPPLDTLAQLRNFDEGDLDFSVDAYTDVADKKPLLKRARRKYFTDFFVRRLVDASKSNDASVLKKSYWNTYHCAKALHIVSDGTVRGKYCKNRWCLVCNSISTARLINKYKPVLDTWIDKHMVTLTVPNCKGFELKDTISMMYYYFVLCKDVFRKRKSKFVGLRKLECTYNAITNEFHPHFHIIVNGEGIANQLVDEWLKRLHYAKRIAQDVRKVDDDGVTEVFKYFSKVISKTGNSKNTDKSKTSFVYADAQDYIFNAVRGRRVFQPFGFVFNASDGDGNASSTDSIDELQVMAIAEWDTNFHDWFRIDTGEGISGYVPSKGFKELVTQRIVVRPNYMGN